MSKYESEAERLIEPFHNLDSQSAYRRVTMINRACAVIILRLSIHNDLAAMDLYRGPEPILAARRALRNVTFDDDSQLGEFITYSPENQAQHNSRLLLTKTPSDGFYRSYEVRYYHEGGRGVQKEVRTITAEDARDQYLKESELIANGIELEAAKRASPPETILNADAMPATGPVLYVGDREMHDASSLLRGYPFLPYP